MAEEKIKAIGVRIPNTPDIYEPVMKELENQNIKMIEKRRRLK
jgi:hypothetical protein